MGQGEDRGGDREGGETSVFCFKNKHLVPDSDCNIALSAGIYFSSIICLQFKQPLFVLLQKCKKFENSI